MLAPPPPPIQELERACIEYVRRALGIELDRSPETLPILDHYLLNLVRSTQVEPILDLVSRCAGAYFGEVVRHAMGQGRWCISSEHPGEWRLEMEHVFLYFFPVGMVREVIAGTPLPEWYGNIGVKPAEKELLAQLLDQLGPVEEHDFFSLSMRYEIIEHLVRNLEADAIVRGDWNKYYSQEAYEEALRAEESPSAS